MIKQFRDEHRWLSNFTPVKIILDGIEYASVEHAYMSAKSDDMEWKSKCADKQVTAGQIKRLSKEIELRDDWEDIKVSIMTECCTQKFNQEPFKQQLLDTKVVRIEEGNTWNDTFWGINIKTGEGKNILGEIIMSIRWDLFNELLTLWHESPDEIDVWDFMKLTKEEYKIFVINQYYIDKNKDGF